MKDKLILLGHKNSSKELPKSIGPLGNSRKRCFPLGNMARISGRYDSLIHTLDRFLLRFAEFSLDSPKDFVYVPKCSHIAYRI